MESNANPIVENRRYGDEGRSPPAVPSFQVVETTASSVSVDWSPVLVDELDYYSVAVDGADTVVVPAGTTGTTLSRLAPGTTYELSVIAVDVAGRASSPSTITAETQPLDDRQ